MAQIKRKVLAIPGSTRKDSSNYYLIKAIAELTKDSLDITIFEGIASLPHFYPDYNAEAPAEVTDFRNQLSNSDGVLICTPEYAHGVPGTLKNAIDWTVSSAEFSHKPTVLITASTDGKFGHAALLEILRVIEAKDIDQFQLLIQFVRTKISNESKITDEKTLTEVKQLMDGFISSLGERERV